MPFTWSLVLAALGAADAGGYVFPPDVRAKEDALVQSFGLRPPDGGVLLPAPGPPADPRQLVVPARWHAEKVPERVDTAALRADLPVLLTALQQGYAGYDRAVKRGWDWALWHKEWDTQLEERKGQVPLAEAFSMLEQVREFQPDGVTGVVGLPDPWRSLTSTLEKAPRGSCNELRTVNGKLVELNSGDAAQRARAVEILRGKGSKLDHGWMVSLPEPAGNPKQLECSGGKTEAFATWNPPPQARLSLVKALGGTDGPGLKELEPGLWWLRPGGSADLSKLPKDAVVLVDLRQMSSAAGAPELLKALGAPANLPQPLLVRRMSCGAAGLRFGALQFTQLNGRPHPLPEAQPLVSALQPGTCRDAAVEKSGGPVRGRKKPSFKPRSGLRVVALVDNGCEGACETLAFQLSYLPDAILAGTATAGRAEYTEAGRMVLPRSRVPIQVALARRELTSDGRPFDGFGLPPDVLIEDQENWAPDSLRAFARSLLPAPPKSPKTPTPKTP